MAESKSAALPLGDTPANTWANYSEKIKKSKLFHTYNKPNEYFVNFLIFKFIYKNFHFIEYLIYYHPTKYKHMATNKITVELLQDIAHIGRKWAIVEMSAPQARNSLIPKWIAREITPDRLKKIELDKKKAQDQARERLEKAFEIQKELDGQVLEFSLRGKWTKVFGGLDEHTVGTRIMEKYGIKFEKRDIKLPNTTHIKTAWRHMVYLHITRDTLAKVFVEVTITD